MAADTYSAFISYRHVQADREWAIWLHGALETYRTPRRLQRAGVPPKLQKVFRDEEELAASSDLGDSIRQALVLSDFLIVVCSRQTPASQWINEEVAEFRRLGRANRILALLIDGEPHEAFPAQLLAAHEGNEASEPLAADARPRDAESVASRRKTARLKLLAPLLGCSYDDLREREQERAHRRLVITLATVAILLLVFVALATVAYRQRNEARAQLQAVLREQGRRELSDGRPLRALAFLEQAYALGDRSVTVKSLLSAAFHLAPSRSLPLPERDWLAGMLFRSTHPELFTASGSAVRVWSLEDGRLLRTIDAGERVHALRLSPDAKTVLVSASRRPVQVHSADDGGLRFSLPSTEDTSDATFSPDGRLIATAHGNGTAHLWKSSNGAHVHALDHLPPPGRPVPRYPVMSAQFTPDSRFLWTSTADDVGRLWDLESYRVLRTFALDGQVTRAEFSRDGTRLVVHGSSLQVWDVATAELRFRIDERSMVSAFHFSPDGTLLLTGHHDGVARLWDGFSGALVRVFSQHTDEIADASFSSDGSSVITASNDATARIWSTKTGEPLQVLTGHSWRVVRATLSPDGRFAATLSADGSAAIWQTGGGLLRGTVAHPGVMAAFSPDGRTAITTGVQGEQGAGAEDVTRIWDVEGARVKHVLPTSRECGPQDLDADRSGRYVLRLTCRSVEVWDAGSGALLREFELQRPGTAARFAPDGDHVVVFHAGDVWYWQPSTDSKRHLGSTGESSATVAFSRDGAWLATGGAKRVWIWDLSSGDLIRGVDYLPDADMERAGPTLVSSRFSADRRFLVLYGFSRVVRLLETATWTEAGAFGPHPQHVSSAAIDPLAGRLFTSSGPTVFAWDLRTRIRVGELSGHSAAVALLADSPDGTRLATTAVDPDRTIRLWDAATLESILPLTGHRGQIHRLQFTPDGRSLVSAAFDGTIRIWRAEMDPGPPAWISFAVKCRSQWRIDAGLLREAVPDPDACRAGATTPR